MAEELLPFLGALAHAPGWGVAFLDREQRPLWLSDALIALVGRAPSAHMGRPLAEVWPGLAPALTPLLERVAGGERVVEAPVAGVLGRGEEGVRHLRVNLTPATQGGVLCGFVLVMRDETERVREEQGVREREEQLRGLAEVSCDGYGLQENGTFVEVSHTLARLFDTTPEEMVGRPVLRWVAPESRDTVRGMLQRGVEAPYELVGLRQNGQRLRLELLEREVPWHGRTARLVTLWDISARKAAEEASTRILHFRDQFLGFLGNDFRPPVSTLRQGAAALARTELAEPQARQVEGMAEAARRLERMVQDLLDYTRSRLAGGVLLSPESVCLGELVEQAVAAHREAQPARRIALTTEGDLRGLWDEARMAQLVEQVLGHSVQASPRDAALEVKVEGISEGVTLSVANDGPALSVDEQTLLFEPSRRTRRMPPPGGGLGLGLYLARQIALAHGGRISVEAGLSRGTRFIVWLPREAPSSAISF